MPTEHELAPEVIPFSVCEALDALPLLLEVVVEVVVEVATAEDVDDDEAAVDELEAADCGAAED